jgi:hypothetical protein
MVSDRGRYCKSGVLSLSRMRVNLPVVGSLLNSQMPAQLNYVSTKSKTIVLSVLTESVAATR